MANIGGNLITLAKDWPGLKLVSTSRGLSVQFDEDSDCYEIFCVDGNVVYLASIYKGTVPHASGVSQATNDAYKSDFETNFKPKAIKPTAPRTSDGKQIFLPNLFPGGVLLYYAGCGDDASGGRGAGTKFQINSSTEGDSVVESYFNDWVYIAGGCLMWSGGDIEDWVSLELVAPATQATAVPGGDGNCNVVNGVIVPAAGNGGYNVTLANAVPVPAFDEETGISTGYWDWDNPDTGKGAVTPSSTPGVASWHLLTADILLARFAAKMPLLGSGNNEITVPAIKPKKVLPHWRMKVTAHNHSNKALKVAWILITARTKTA